LQVQFSVNHTLAGNEAYRIFNQKKIDYVLNSNKNSIRKHSADDEGIEDARSYKHRRDDDDKSSRTPEDKVVVFFHSFSILACNKSSLSSLACIQIRTVTFEEEESSTSAMSYIPVISVESSTSKDLVIDTKDEDVFNMMLCETYLNIR